MDTAGALVVLDRNAYAKAIGTRLRRARRCAGMSLRQVEDRSAGRFTAVAVGSYERADRAVTAARLADLATFYGVAPASLLPDPADIPADADLAGAP